MGNKDRDYYASLSTTTLLEAVTYEVNPDWRELAIALARRLDDEVRCSEILRDLSE